MQRTHEGGLLVRMELRRLDTSAHGTFCTRCKTPCQVHLKETIMHTCDLYWCRSLLTLDIHTLAPNFVVALRSANGTNSAINKAPYVCHACGPTKVMHSLCPICKERAPHSWTCEKNFILFLQPVTSVIDTFAQLRFAEPKGTHHCGKSGWVG